jgi:hypothetical protein
MKTLIGVAAAAGLTLLGTAAMAQPYGYYRPYSGYAAPSYGYDGRGYYRDSDRDGIPDRAEWGRDRDHDGRPDQWDRDDNRREWRRHHHWRDGYSYWRGYDYRY